KSFVESKESNSRIARSKRGTDSALHFKKSTSVQKVKKEGLIPLEEPNDKEHKPVVFIDNVTGKAKFCLYGNTEKAEPTSHLWKDFFVGKTRHNLNILPSAASILGAPNPIGEYHENPYLRHMKKSENVFLFQSSSRPGALSIYGHWFAKSSTSATKREANGSVGPVSLIESEISDNHTWEAL
ncbi:MAG: hypothetical protein Q9226_004882, partial [Calogaya cf. arnoldii]